MATESIGALIPTAIPGYSDAADIQAALRAYHYGSYSYSPANTSPGSLVTPSMAKTIYDIQQDIVDLENRPASGGEVNPTQPAATSFTPPEIPDGFIWVDEDGTIGGQPKSATAIFTNSAPTTDLTTGLVWIDKDATTILDNPYIPQSVINAKGDLIVGTGNDAASVLTAASTNGFVLSVNSSTATGLAWTSAVDTTVVATTNNTLTMTNKTLSGATLTGTLTAASTSGANGQFLQSTGSGVTWSSVTTDPNPSIFMLMGA